MNRLHNKESEIRILLVLPLPILQRLAIVLLIHIFTALPQFLIVNDVNIRALLSLLLDPSRILFQPLHNQLFIHLLLIPKSKQCNLFIG